MHHSGTADLPLYSGSVPPWLAERMSRLGVAIAEAIIQEEGPTGFLARLADPFWFQSFRAVFPVSSSQPRGRAAVTRKRPRERSTPACE